MERSKDSIDEHDELVEKWENEEIDKLFARWDHEPKKTKVRFAWVKDALRAKH